MRDGFKWLLGFALVITLMFSPATVSAATDADVIINATPAWVSISNNLTTFDFGTVYVNISENTTASGGFNVTNGGSVVCNVTIKCDNWSYTSGSNDWTYGAAGDNTSRLMFNLDGGNYTGEVSDNVTAGAVLNASLAAGSSQLWGLEIEAPSTIGHGDAQQTTITLTGVEV